MLVVDDSLAGGVDAEGDERTISGRTKAVHAICRDSDRHSRLHHDDAILAVEPCLAGAFENGQQLDVRMRVGLCGVAGRRNLDASANRQAFPGIVADDRTIGGAAGKCHGWPVGMANEDGLALHPKLRLLLILNQFRSYHTCRMVDTAMPPIQLAERFALLLALALSRRSGSKGCSARP